MTWTRLLCHRVAQIVTRCRQDDMGGRGAASWVLTVRRASCAGPLAWNNNSAYRIGWLQRKRAMIRDARDSMIVSIRCCSNLVCQRQQLSFSQFPSHNSHNFVPWTKVNVKKTNVMVFRKDTKPVSCNSFR